MPAKNPVLPAQGPRSGSRFGHCLLWAGLLFGQASQAQTAPSAGQLLREAQPLQRPAPRNDAAALPTPPAARAELVPPAGLKLRVSAVRISGVQTQPLEALQALVDDATGRELDFAALQALAERITEHYRREGYVLARAYLPAQKIEGGRIEIAVIEGRLGQIRLNAVPPLPQATLAAYLKRMKTDQPLRNEALEGDLLALSDVPGLRVRSVLRPGQAVGTSDLDIEVTPGDRVNGNLSLDNHGNRFTGADRLSGRLGVANPIFFGDTLELNAVTAGHGYRYGRLAWQLPLGASGWQAGLAQSGMNYRLGKNFESLDASGSANDTTVYLLKNLLRSRIDSLDLNLAYDRKRFDDAASGNSSTKRADVGSASLSGRKQGASSVTAGNLTLTAGRLNLEIANADADAQGHRTAGRYGKLNGQFSHDQSLAGFGLSLRLSGQLAAKNLDSSEKMALGGAQAVRAYPQGEASSDDAVLLNAEAWRDFDGWRAKVFADGAHGRNWHKPLPGDTVNRNTQSGVGVGVDANLPGQLLLQAVAAHRTGRASSSDVDRSLRVWLQISKNF